MLIFTKSSDECQGIKRDGLEFKSNYLMQRDIPPLKNISTRMDILTDLVSWMIYEFSIQFRIQKSPI